ncbi:metallophosphoesterase [Flavobacterium sp. HJSW_4]|uniref:metallophosphoesterase n=1 Tax=Flavobacterium sp. HJSW_4 TaxID=3344660 RepID=UPI0035F2540F
MDKGILHITDLHLNDFEGTLEHLRRRYYQEYIDNLVDKIKKNEVKVNYLIITGDFIDKGKIENFVYVNEIINYICLELEIDTSNVCCNIGNHDYKWKEENGDFSRSAEFRTPYNKFIEPYEGEVLFKSDRCFLKKLGGENIFYISIDSTLNSENGKPGKITSGEVDEIISDVLKKHLNENSILLIGCHFPIISDDSNFLASEEENWHENHVWIKGTPLRERISNLKTLHTVWFQGDVHAGQQKNINNSTYILTGRFGGPIDTISEFPRQCKLLTLNTESKEKSIYTYRFNFKTHSPSESIGDWESIGPSDIRIIESTQTTPISTSIVVPNDSNIKVIDSEIEDEIMLDITNNNLFRFGRFKTNQEFSSMGWININSLMNQPVLLSRILEKSIKYIIGLINSKNSECLIIGLEVIGGIIASQISVRLNTKNFIFPVRGNGKFYSDEETNKTKLFNDIASMKEVVIFIDVISSGKTMEEFVASLKKENPNVLIHVISVITNNISIRPTQILNSSSYATFCNKLKIPLVNNNDLPDESIFPSILDFT